MHQTRESFVSRVTRAPEFDDERKTHAASANLAIAWTAILGVTPLTMASVLLIPHVAVVAITVALALDVASAAAIYFVSRRRVVLASAVLGISTWAVFTFAILYTGGLTSAAVGGLLLLVALTGTVNGWMWGLPATVLAGGTLLAVALAESAGRLPQSIIEYSPWAQAAGFALCLVVLAGFQAAASADARRPHSRAARAAAERRSSQKRLLDVVDNAPFGALVCALDRHGLLSVVHVNRAASEVLGIDAELLVGKPIDQAFSALSGGSLLATFEEIASEGGRHHARSVPYYADGHSGTLELHAFQISPNSMAVFFSDVTQRNREHVQIHQMAFHDDLTKLPNRKLLLDRLGVALAGAQRRGTQVALLFIDLDNFKPLNDRFGHGLGDDLLIAVGQRLMQCARASDTVARFGGDEFTVLVPDVLNTEQVETVARKLVAALAEPFMIGTRSICVTASIGVAMTADDDRCAETLIERADNAMYRAKRAGRNRYRVG